MRFILTSDQRVVLVNMTRRGVEIIGQMTLQDYTDLFGFRQASVLVRDMV